MVCCLQGWVGAEDAKNQKVDFKIRRDGKQQGFLWMLLEVGHSLLLCAGMNSNRATTRTFYLPSHGDENIPVAEKCSQKVLTQPERWGSIQMAYDFIQNGLLVPTTVFLWIFSNLCKEFIHMILIKVSFERGKKKKSPKLFEKGRVIWAADVLVRKILNISSSILHCHLTDLCKLR